MRKHILFLFAFFSGSLLTAQTLTEITITFQVNMEFEIAVGKFNPSTDTLSARGSFNNWSDDTILTPSLADSNIYEGSAQFETFESNLIHYKFVYTSAWGTNWEDDPNYEHTITADDITNGLTIVPLRGYNQPRNWGYVDSFIIRFIVDMNNAIDTNGVTFPSIDNVVIAGVHPLLVFPISGWPDSDSNKVVLMFDDGTNGDEIADDNFWTKEVSFLRYSQMTIQYKYGANWGLISNGGTNNNEAGVGSYHFINIFTNFEYDVVVDVFGVMGEQDVVNSVEQIGSEVPENYELKQNYPNPFNPTTIK